MLNSKRSVLIAAALVVLGLILAGCDIGTPPPCSQELLVKAINDANANGPGTDVIDLDGSCVFQLGDVDNTVDGNNGLPAVTSSIVINGNGATVRRSSGAQKAAIRLFYVGQGGDLTINDLILYDGMGMEPPDTTILVRNSGGAIYNNGTLTVNSSVFDYNRARRQGGAIFNAGTMTVSNTAFQNNGVNIGNEPGESGGAIFNTGTATLTACTLSGNIASQSGAGITNTGTMTVTNSTISGNSTTIAGLASGAAVMNSGSITISFTTIAANTSTTAGAVFSAPDTIEIHNTIIADNIGGNCSYPPTSMILGMNIDSDGSCGGMVLADPQLGPLANYGGLTMTHSIAPTSPARDTAFGLCPATDQRGEPRPHGSECDLGSFEYSGNVPPADTSQISGLVYNDADESGLPDPGEAPFDGVELVLASGSCASPGVSQSALSASDGSFQFELYPPTAGNYCLSIDPLTPPNDTILIPGNFTQPPSGQYEFTLAEGEDLTDQDFGWDFQFSPGYADANLVITDVTLSDTSIAKDDWVEVEVTVENQGLSTASGYDVVLIPHYGWGPPNPGGYEAIPDLAPGASHTIVFSPGVLYSNIGTFTLRVLVTDDWYELGDPDSTGTAGDYQDFEIQVLAYFCNLLDGLEIKPVILALPPDTRILPIYLKAEADVFPGVDPAANELLPEFAYSSELGDIKSLKCGPQGFPNRLYCLLLIPEGEEGTEKSYKLFLPDCPNPVYEIPAILIPKPQPTGPVCKADLNEADCIAAGGSFYRLTDKTSTCICP
ncbi:MAG: choice-of-anchor Q domain-containing protein [Anaerolineales bacterium]